MSSATLSAEAVAYLAELERELADLPRDEREDLLEEVEASLIEAGDDPVGHLGTPARFAAELRASAGLPPRPALPAPPKEPFWMRVKRSPRTHAALGIARELAPLWWVARGCVVVALFTIGVQTRYRGIVPRLLGYPALDLALCALVPIVSVAIGLLGRRHRFPLRPLRIALDLGLAACLIFVPGLLNEINGRTDDVVFVQSEPAAPRGLARSGVALRNVYPYDRKGRLLHDVRLYDQDGKPLELGRGSLDPDRRLVETRGRFTVFNAFPIRYYEPGTHRVAHPNAVPADLKPSPLR
jgi:hypothetical protein